MTKIHCILGSSGLRNCDGALTNALDVNQIALYNSRKQSLSS